MEIIEEHDFVDHGRDSTGNVSDVSFSLSGRSLICSNSNVVCSLFFPELEAEDSLQECVDGGVKILLLDPFDENEGLGIVLDVLLYGNDLTLSTCFLTKPQLLRDVFTGDCIRCLLGFVAIGMVSSSELELQLVCRTYVFLLRVMFRNGEFEAGLSSSYSE